MISAVAALTLSTIGCKQTIDTTGQPIAEKQVEEAQKQSAEAYDRAKKAQENAADEAREAAHAEHGVEAKRQELMEAEQNAAASQQEAQQAQQAAQAEGDAAHQEAQEAQERAAAAQQAAAHDLEARRYPSPKRTMTPYSTATTRDVQRLQRQIDEAIETIKNTAGDTSITRPINPMVK